MKTLNSSVITVAKALVFFIVVAATSYTASTLTLNHFKQMKKDSIAEGFNYEKKCRKSTTVKVFQILEMGAPLLTFGNFTSPMEELLCVQVDAYLSSK